MKITVKSHKRKRKNGVSIVKQHSRKGSAAYNVKEQLKHPHGKYTGKYKGLNKAVAMADYDNLPAGEDNITDKNRSTFDKGIKNWNSQFDIKTPRRRIAKYRDALRNYGDEGRFEKSHNNKGYAKKKK